MLINLGSIFAFLIALLQIIALFYLLFKINRYLNNQNSQNDQIIYQLIKLREEIKANAKK